MSQLLTEQTPWTQRGLQHSLPKNGAPRPAQIQNLQKYLEYEKLITCVAVHCHMEQHSDYDEDYKEDQVHRGTSGTL